MISAARPVGVRYWLTGSLVASLAVLAACSETTAPGEAGSTPGGGQDTTPGTGDPAGSDPPGQSGEPGEPGAADPAAPSDPADPQTPEQPGEGPGTGSQGTAGAGSEPGGEPGAGSPGTGDARYPDACAERRVSWSRPCHDNPDPCGLDSGWAGDEYCLLPPPEGEGVQIHFGPSDYTDEAEVARYVLQPNEEFNSYAIVNIPTTESHWFKYMKLSMRPGSHHVINTLVAGHPAEGFLPAGSSCDGQQRLGSFPGTQNLILESPPQGIPAPENDGLGRELPGNASICQNYHRYNYTDEPVLNEIWYNVWFADEDEITQRATGVSVFAGPLQPIPPGERRVLEATTNVRGDGRILTLFGHRHAATERFAVWVRDELIYDSWDWVESRVFNYDSITQNPAPNPEAAIDGASSGMLEVSDGDSVRIECHVNNQTDVSLRFANELYTGEMCILFGSSVGATISAGLGGRQ